jgi:hypothetical protein
MPSCLESIIKPATENPQDATSSNRISVYQDATESNISDNNQEQYDDPAVIHSIPLAPIRAKKKLDFSTNTNNLADNSRLEKSLGSLCER